MNEISEDIFKAYDIRGKVGTELNTKSVENIGKAFADWLPNKGVVAVGRDMRSDSNNLSEALINGIRKQGIDVWDIGEVTSDMIYFAVGNYSLVGGAMITASHNPGEYNGIKLCREEAKPIGESSGLLDIKELVLKDKFKESSKNGSLESKDIVEKWIEHVLTFIDIDKLRSLKIAVDAGNGMAGKIFPEIEPYLPFEIEEMYFKLDGTFPNHIANPLILENLADLQKTVIKNKCDAGIAFDGDGDRAVIIDELGVPISGSVLTALLAKYFLSKNPGATVLYNAICGKIVPETIEKAGGKAIRTKVGHSFIKNDMRKYNAVFAGEHSGHYYFRDNFMADSGLVAAMISMYILSVENRPLSNIVTDLKKKYVQIEETNLEVEDKESVIKKAAKVFEGEQQDLLDGLTVTFPDGWFNIRPSNTEPLLRLNAEASSKEILDKIVSQVRSIITK